MQNGTVQVMGLYLVRSQVRIVTGLLTNLKASFLCYWRYADFFLPIILILVIDLYLNAILDYDRCSYQNPWRIIIYLLSVI